MSHIRSEKTGWLDKINLYPEHIDLLKTVARHSIYWAKDIVNKFYFKGPRYTIVKLLVNYFINYVEKRLNKIEEDVERYKEMLKQARAASRKEVLVFSN
jgi:hypothetical protein